MTPLERAAKVPGLYCRAGITNPDNDYAEELATLAAVKMVLDEGYTIQRGIEDFLIFDAHEPLAERFRAPDLLDACLSALEPDHD